MVVIHETEERFRGAFDSAAIGMALLELDGRWLEANRWLCDIVGYTAQELLRLTFQDIIHPGDVASSLDCVRQLIDGEIDSFQLEKRCVHRRGHVVWVQISGSIVKNAGSVPLCLTVQVQDISDRKHAEDDLAIVAVEQSATLEVVRHRSFHDVLTDLPNRTLLSDRLHHTILAARRDRTKCALLFLDLDRFKRANDSLGHHAGDLLLQAVTKRIQQVLRESDTFARMGGDEFAIVLPRVDETEAHLVAKKILNALDAPIPIENSVAHVGASIGIALYPEHGETVDLLMTHADVAMYVAKRNHFGHVTYSPEHDVNTPSRLVLAAKLRQAIERSELVLHYQPQIVLQSGQPSGVEALVRWQHDTHGLIPPGEFIPVAEHAGLIGPLSRWIIDAALQQCRAWQDMGLSLRMAVNLSATNLLEAGMADFIAMQLAWWNISPDLLEIEITETGITIDPDQSLHAIARLRQLGVRIAIDDFGASYSSLPYLARLPVHGSKIGPSFVRRLASAGHDRSPAAIVVRSMIDLGHSLGLEVVGVGVETAETLGMLKSMHCDLAQGFYVCPPLPAPELTARWAKDSKI